MGCREEKLGVKNKSFYRIESIGPSDSISELLA